MQSAAVIPPDCATLCPSQTDTNLRQRKVKCACVDVCVQYLVLTFLVHVCVYVYVCMCAMVIAVFISNYRLKGTLKNNKNVFQSKAYHPRSTEITKTFTIDKMVNFFKFDLDLHMTLTFR